MKKDSEANQLYNQRQLCLKHEAHSSGLIHSLTVIVLMYWYCVIAVSFARAIPTIPVVHATPSISTAEWVVNATTTLCFTVHVPWPIITASVGFSCQCNCQERNKHQQLHGANCKSNQHEIEMCVVCYFKHLNKLPQKSPVQWCWFSIWLLHGSFPLFNVIQ